MQVVFFGSGAFGLPTLDQIARVHDVVLTVTQPDRPAGRARRLTPTPVAAYAADHGLPLIKPEDVNDPEVVQRIRAAGADVFVVIAYGHKLRPPLLEDVFAMNLHGSLLPKYRGAAPISWAIMNGDHETGVSIITLSQTMDAGLVLAQRATRIDPMETAGELHDRLAEMGPDVMLETLHRHAAGALDPRPQDETRVSRAPKLSKAEGTVRFDQPADVVRCRVHGLTPWPGCRVRLERRILKILRAQAIEHIGAVEQEPGEVLGDRRVKCEPGSLALLSVQPPGGKAMTFDAYCHGHGVQTGARFRPL